MNQNNKYLFESNGKTHVIVSDEQRHNALKRAVNEYGALNVYRKLDAVAKLTTRTIPQASKLYEKDKNWIKEKYGSA